MPDGTLTFAEVERRTFTKDGQEKPVWNMKDGEGRRFSTFDAAIAQAILDHMGKPLAAQWSEKQKGEYLNRTIVALPGLVEKQQGGGGRGPAVDEDRADRRAALAAAVAAVSVGTTPDVLSLADTFVAWLQNSAGARPTVPDAAPGGPPAEPSLRDEPARNPWNVWIEETFPNLSANEHRKLVKAALTTNGLEKLPEFGSTWGLQLRAEMSPGAA